MTARRPAPTPLAAHVRYATYLARHKWFVLVAGRRLGLPLWRLIVHDRSKLSPAEWGPYVRHFRAPEAERPGEFERAWLHHQHHNPHHWQHWLEYDGDGVTALAMPGVLVREMVADWSGARRATTGKWDPRPWYATNAETMVLHPETRAEVERLL